MNVANEVSTILTEVESLRSEVRILRENKIVTDFEMDQLRRRCTISDGKTERLIASNASLKTLLDRVGADLVAGLQRHNIETGDVIGIAEEPRLIERAAE